MPARRCGAEGRTVKGTRDEGGDGERREDEYDYEYGNDHERVGMRARTGRAGTRMDER